MGRKTGGHGMCTCLDLCAHPQGSKKVTFSTPDSYIHWNGQSQSLAAACRRSTQQYP